MKFAVQTGANVTKKIAPISFTKIKSWSAENMDLVGTKDLNGLIKPKKSINKSKQKKKKIQLKTEDKSKNI